MRQLSSGLWAACVAVLVSGCSSFGPQGRSASPAASVPPPPPAIGASTAPVGGTCSAQGAQSFVGQMATAKATEQARVRSGARMARIVRAGQPATTEYLADRLNLSVDQGGKIVGVTCG
ncbi:proteinase inhibitor I78 [Diaphorobacter ruginosibacter]|uniref:Proteinase inhibitor I78 n=1 Tax=Diaphorobacter ruginosibacter TaxID=1715720 RepID=A0A7G9RRQ9_9BURK|nr:proteinase inhibitor I78 [Diaphorobacter ruginosibacter]